MAIALKVLKFTTVATGTPLQLNPSTGGKGWLIKRMCFHNAQASAITLDLYITPAGSGSNFYLYKGCSIAAGSALSIENEVTLNNGSSGDKLTASITGASPLDCVIDGMERDQ
jgi:hypothetical protein